MKKRRGLSADLLEAEKQDGGGTLVKGRIVWRRQGDVTDIGKNIVGVVAGLQQ